MSNILDLSLTKIVNGIKKKDFTSEEVTKAYIENSKKSKKLNELIKKEGPIDGPFFTLHLHRVGIKFGRVKLFFYPS